MRLLIVSLLQAILVFHPALSQDQYQSRYEEYPDPKRFINEIDAQLKEAPFKKTDKKLIVFTGSSSIRFWMGLEDDFSDYDILNRGFGGSIFSDLNYFMDDLILKHESDLIVIYEGDNDISFKIPNEIIIEDFIESHKKIRKKKPDTPVIYIAAKPSPSRWDKKDSYLYVNKKIQDFCEENKNTYFFDSWSIMLDEDGNIPEKYFWRDMLHMNRSGYEVWAKNIKPLINKILE